MSYFLLYFFLYRIAAIAAVPLLMIALSHTDRVHMRERARRLGVSIVKSAQSTLVKEDTTLYRFLLFYVRLYIWRPICILTEMVGGLNEGIENLEPTVMIAEPYSAFRIENSINQVMTHTRPEPIDCPYQNDPDTEVDVEEMLNNLKPRSGLGNVDPDSHKNIAGEIFRTHKNNPIDNSDDDSSDHEQVSISTQGDSASENNSYADDDTDSDSDASNDSRQRSTRVDERRGLRRGRSRESRSRSQSRSQSRSRSRSAEPRRRGFRVKRVAPRKNKGRIRLARRR
jgi:hypothetical protein